MPTFKLEDVICWADNNDKVLCSDCFNKEFPDYPSDWEPIFSKNDGEMVYECDSCKERFVS